MTPEPCPYCLQLRADLAIRLTYRGPSIPKLSDERLAFLAEDRTGFRTESYPDAMTRDEVLSVIDELRSWRRYRLTAPEKQAIRELATAHPTHPDLQSLAAKFLPPTKETIP